MKEQLIIFGLMIFSCILFILCIISWYMISRSYIKGYNDCKGEFKRFEEGKRDGVIRSDPMLTNFCIRT